MQVPAPIEYARATSVEDAVGLLERLGEEARVIAGGHSLLPMMKLRLATPEYLVDINDLHDSLSYVEAGRDVVRIGAMTRHRELLESDLLWELFPIFRDAEQVIADPPVRNRGTLGGALCQADPSEDLSSVCTTLDAVCVIQGSSGTREVPMDEFHLGPYQTAVGQAELLIEVRIPVRPHGGSAYLKVDRRAGDWAVVAAGAAVWLDDDGLIADARVGLAAVGPNTTGIPEVSAALHGRPPDEEAFAEAGRLAAAGCRPVTDARGTEAYKRHLADELTRRTLRTAAARAAGLDAGSAADGT
jgi:aerobic carbon-monoxide dehydrogenase medium subunit